MDRRDWCEVSAAGRYGDVVRCAFLGAGSGPSVDGEVLVEIFSLSGDPFLRHGDVVTECLLAAAVRADIVATRIEPALRDHDVVIEDRGVHTMFSYGLASLMRQHAVEVDDAVSWLDGLGPCGAESGPRPVAVVSCRRGDRAG